MRRSGRPVRTLAYVLASTAATIALVPTGAEALETPTLSGAVSDSAVLPGIDAVAVSGQYAYVVDYYAGKVTAINIANPAAPEIAGSSAANNNLLDASTINIAGGYAYVVSKNRNGPKGSESNDDGTGNSLTVLDITTNPAVPTIVGTVRDANTLFGGYGVAASGHYVFTASQGCISSQPCPNHNVGCAFAVIDVSNPASPTIVAALHSVSLPKPWNTTGALGHPTSVALAGNYAYVTAAYQYRLTIINVANPLSPQIVASLKDTTNLAFPVDVALSGHYAYVANQTSPGRLTVLDVSNPANPQVVSYLSSTSLAGAYRIRIRGDFAYVSASSAATIAVVDISNPLAPRLAATFTDTAHLHTTTGLDLDASSTHVVATSPYLGSQAQPLYPPFALQTGGPTLTGTLSDVALDPAPIAATIATSSEPANPTAQTSANFSFSANDAVSATQCQLDGAGWSLCTTPSSQEYSALAAGSHTFSVQAIDSAANTSTASYTWTVTPPTNSVPPSVSGSAAIGQTLTASTGTWAGAPSFAYQWLRCEAVGTNCTPIQGATSSTYTATSADAGSTLAAQVTATTSAGSTSVTSSPTLEAVTGPPLNTLAPSISGTATVGQELALANDSWSGYPVPSLTYQWERCNAAGESCSPITGANATTYTPQPGDAGSTLLVVVTATNSAGSAQATSPVTATVTAAPANTGAPSISGAAMEGQQLTASAGSWTGNPTPTYTYQWERCNTAGESCTPIVGATATGYTALAADVGSTLRVAVVATNSAGSGQAASGVGSLVLASAGPVTGVLDNFARPNNTGPPSPSWTHMVVSSSSPTNDLHILGEQLTGYSGSNADYWNQQTYGPNSEDWVTIAVKPNIDQDPVVLGLRFQNPGAATAGGYQAYYIYRSSGQDQYKIIARVNGTTSTTLASTTGPKLAAGDQLLFRAIGTTLELWRGDAGTWTRLLSATDTTFTGAGYLNLTARDSAVRLANFGGGTLP